MYKRNLKVFWIGSKLNLQKYLDCLHRKYLMIGRGVVTLVCRTSDEPWVTGSDDVGVAFIRSVEWSEPGVISAEPVSSSGQVMIKLYLDPGSHDESALTSTKYFFVDNDDFLNFYYLDLLRFYSQYGFNFFNHPLKVHLVQINLI